MAASAPRAAARSGNTSDEPEITPTWTSRISASVYGNPRVRSGRCFWSFRTGRGRLPRRQPRSCASLAAISEVMAARLTSGASK
jgi:hypothetical protein